jgi:dynein heavy chain
MSTSSAGANSLSLQTGTLSDRLVRAEKLLEAFNADKEAWVTKADQLRQSHINSVGNTLISAAFVVYLGPFTQPYRDRVLQSLVKFMSSVEPALPIQQDYRISTVLGDPIEVKEWELFKLPVDDIYADNACIFKHSRKWPLFIDPQDQVWICILSRVLIVG